MFGLDEILTAPVNGSGYNPSYGLLGSNKSTEDKVKLFPRDCQGLVEDIQNKLLEATGKHVEVMVYGDGAFKDPVGKIWELADPVVSPAYTAGLEGTPNELKLKYLADNDFAALSGQALRSAIEAEIKKKDGSLVGNMAAQGTTPPPHHRPHRLPVRPHLRFGGQGHSHRPYPGLFRQLHHRLNREKLPGIKRCRAVFSFSKFSCPPW